MTERQIQRWLFNTLRSTCRVVVPNYTPAHWWECDVFAVTKAGYFHEYEIKLTRGDFKADADKAHTAWGRELRVIDGREVATFGRHRTSLKHERLALASPNGGPTQFWYVVPDGLLAIDDVPSWAGLKYAKGNGNFMTFTTPKPAPRLHREKCDPAIVAHATGVCYWRYWNERRRFDELAERKGNATDNLVHGRHALQSPEHLAVPEELCVD